MPSKILKNKPLVEVIFELRWDLEEIEDQQQNLGPEMGIEPNYQIILGRFYDRIHKEYQYYEKLPAAKMPEDISAYIVQHRFRKDKNSWPLVQLGPGIVTLNDTDNYTWEDFRSRITQLIELLFEVYPKSSENLKFNKIQLRYIDSVEFDFKNNNIFEFLRDKMKTKIHLPDSLFNSNIVNHLPSGLDLRFSFPSNKPIGSINLRFGSGTRRNKSALLWETMIFSKKKDVPNSKSGILEWAIKAHDITHDWFFKIIEGDLEKRFE